jgi:hypothetical protein
MKGGQAALDATSNSDPEKPSGSIDDQPSSKTKTVSQHEFCENLIRESGESDESKKATWLKFYLNCISYNEAARAVIAQRFGVISQIQLREIDGNPDRESIVEGECTFQGDLGERERAIACLAAVIAESIALQCDGPLWPDLIEGKFISPTDLEGIRAYLPGGLADPGMYAFVKEVQRFVLESWTQIEGVADHLADLFEKDGKATLSFEQFSDLSEKLSLKNEGAAGIIDEETSCLRPPGHYYRQKRIEHHLSLEDLNGVPTELVSEKWRGEQFKCIQRLRADLGDTSIAWNFCSNCGNRTTQETYDVGSCPVCGAVFDELKGRGLIEPPYELDDYLEII